jgi:hypothetical protein
MDESLEVEKAPKRRERAPKVEEPLSEVPVQKKSRRSPVKENTPEDTADHSDSSATSPVKADTETEWLKRFKEYPIHNKT